MKSLQGKVLLYFSLLITLTVLLIGSISYYLASNYIKNSVGTLAKNVAYSASTNINLESHKELLNYINSGKSTDEILKLDIYKEMRQELYKTKKLTGLKYIYTMGKTSEGKYMYMVDGFPLDYEGDDISMPGDIEDVDYEYMEKVFETRQLYLGQMTYDDTWGANITAYVPLISETGEFLGLLGVDFEAIEVYKLLEDFKWFFLLIGCIVLLFSSFLCYILSNILVSPLKKLTDFISKIKDGDSSLNLDIKGSYEVEQLSIAFSNLLKKLNETVNNIQYIANHDSLTDLYNRRHFEHLLKSDMEEPNRKLSLAYIDLDGFKLINDNYGHDIGDRVLRITSERILQIVSNKGYVGRVGGDEFIVCLTTYESLDEVNDIFSTLLKELNKTIIINNMEYRCGASIGLTYCPEHTEDLETLLKFADSAMYIAKNKGKNNLIIYRKDFKNV